MPPTVTAIAEIAPLSWWTDAAAKIYDSVNAAVVPVALSVH